MHKTTLFAVINSDTPNGDEKNRRDRHVQQQQPILCSSTSSVEDNTSSSASSSSSSSSATSTGGLVTSTATGQYNKSNYFFADKYTSMHQDLCSSSSSHRTPNNAFRNFSGLFAHTERGSSNPLPRRSPSTHTPNYMSKVSLRCSADDTATTKYKYVVVLVLIQELTF
jgi:hypothetical protein